MTLLIFGEITSDYLLLADEFPEKGCVKLLGERQIPGGSSLNTAVTLHGWKVPLFLAGNMVGGDLWGRAILQYLEDLALPHGIYLNPQIETPRCICLVHRKKHTRSFLLAVKRVREYYPIQTRGLDYSSYTYGFVNTYLGQASEVVLENLRKTPAWILTQDLSPTSPYIGWTQAVQISVPPEDFQEDLLEERAKIYLQGKTQWVFFTGGEEGTLALGKDHKIRVPAHKANPVDTTGCGDAFRAGLLYGLYRGYSIEEALSVASWAGARTSETLGSHGMLPFPEGEIPLKKGKKPKKK